jgi:chemotaxis protein CheC
VDETVQPFTEFQLAILEKAFDAGAQNASDAMSRWLSAPAQITVESIQQLPLEEAPGILGDTDATLCFCTMAMTGKLTGSIVLAFNDEFGLSLSDLLLNHPIGTAVEWGDVEQSAALESANILCTAYLNSLAKHLPSSETITLIPAPPTFHRDFVESQLEAMFMDQAMTANVIFLVQTKFEIRGEPLNWTLLFVPDTQSLVRLHSSLPDSNCTRGV